MHVSRVQRWVASALILTTAFHFVAGLMILAITKGTADAFWVLTIISTVVSLISIAGVRILNSASVLTPWLLFAAGPAVIAMVFG